MTKQMRRRFSPEYKKQSVGHCQTNWTGLVEPLPIRFTPTPTRARMGANRI